MAAFTALIVGAGFLTMLCTLAYQAFLYLKWGYWPGISVTYVCGSPPFEWDWCNFPGDWLGAHNMLSWLNAGVFAFLASCIVACVVVRAAEGQG